MAQQLGETVQEMIKADDQAVQDILNRRPQGHFWIVIHHRPTKMKMKTGEYVLVRLVKDYDKRPQPQLGTIILEVMDGRIVKEQVNVHDQPIDLERLSPLLGLQAQPGLHKRPDIARAYVYNNL
jgi:hypothetical protein